MAEQRTYLGCSVLDAARARIAWCFDELPRLYVSFSGGKDSTVMLHLVMEEAKRRNQRVGVLFVDLEAQYALTIEHVACLFEQYAPWIDPYWVCLPLKLRNAVSQFEPRWMCWEPAREADWVRPLPKQAISDPDFFPFFTAGMEFEEFVEHFGLWYAQGQMAACFVGIRTAESLNRWRSLASTKKAMLDGRKWTTWVADGLYNVYPVYDWATEDIWAYHGNTGLLYNALYDRMYQAGLTIHQMRICQPYGDDQRKGLWLFHLIEPQTWARVVARVNGANQGALYAQESGNILGRLRITKPEGHTWESFSMLLLDSMPERTAEHYRNKIAVFIRWHMQRGYADGIPDDGPLDDKHPSWKRIAKVLLRNDYWCKGLSFDQTNSAAYQRYLGLMKQKRAKWNLM